MKNVDIINLTPHEIIIYKDDKIFAKFPPSGMIARIEEETTKISEINGIPITITKYKNTINLPSESKHTIFIVSKLVKMANLDRDDLVIPNESVRDNKGRIVGCRSFSFKI